MTVPVDNRTTDAGVPGGAPAATDADPAPTSPPPKRPSALYRFFCRLAGCEIDPPGPVAVTLDTAPPATSHDRSSALEHGVSPVAGSDPSPGTAARTTVVADGLTKTYDNGVTAVTGVSLTATAGEIVAVVGPNGAGKSTTLNMLSGLLHPTGGRATVRGVETTDTRRLGATLGVALQTSGIDPAMTALEHFEVQAALYGIPRAVAAPRTKSLIENFGLTPYAARQVSQYSIGLQRRLVVALALLHDPPVVVLDEPTAGLDPQSRRMVWQLLERLRDEGRTIIFSTQLLEEADLLAQRIYVISDGRVVAEGTPSELRRSYGGLTVRVRPAGPLEPVEQLLADQLPGLGTARRDGDCLVFVTSQDNQDTGRVVEVLGHGGVDYLEVSFGRPSLEDAFVRLTGESVRVEPLLTMGASGGLLCRCS